MASFNRVILIGNLTRDPEVRYIPSGMAVCDLGLAVNNRYKNSNGEWVEEATFVDVTLWGRTAEVASEYLSKGSPVFIEGRLKLDTWETDGQKRSKLKVTCERMQLIGPRGAGGSGAGGPGEGGGRARPRPDSQAHANSQFNQSAPDNEAFDASSMQGPPDDDIPF